MAIENSSNELREILLDLAVEVVAPQQIIDSIRRLNSQELRVAADFMLAGLQINCETHPDRIVAKNEQT